MPETNRIEYKHLKGLSQTEFFEGFSVPRNQELMRIFKDLGLVEQLGSGIPRILESYGKECFAFSDNFLRMQFPAIELVTLSLPKGTEQDTEQVTEQVRKLLLSLSGQTYSLSEIMKLPGLKHRPTVKYNYIDPALQLKVLAMTIPDKPNSRLQKYRLTALGKEIRENLSATVFVNEKKRRK